MSPITQPDARPLTATHYILHADYVVHGPMTQDMGWRIPAGFVFDGASVPRWLWSITGLAPDGLHRAAVLVHDYLYYHQGRTGDLFIPHYSRRQADKLMRRLMILSGVPRSRAWVAYLAARLFGGAAWRRKTFH